jgi:TonB family protein
MTLLLDSAWKATPILALAWLATLLLRRASADLRHRFWLDAILAVAVLPAALSLAPAALPASARIIVSSTAAAVASPHVPHFDWILAIWIAGMLAVLARLAIGTFAVARLTPFSSRVQTPLTWGILKPAIILPAYMREWTGEPLDMVMRHEQAHIERHDWFWQTLTRVVAAAFWFHPLVWIADAALRREAETAADNRVLAEGTAAVDYAQQLLSVARCIQAPTPAAAVAMVRKPKLETRVRQILDAKRNRSRAGISARIAIALIAAALLIPLTAIGQDDKVYKIGEPGLTPPSVISKTEPQYTPEAKDQKVQGTVVMRMVIDRDGIAQDIAVVQSLDEGLDQSAVDAVSHWHFAPAKKDGKPVRVFATIEVNFRLN